MTADERIRIPPKNQANCDICDGLLDITAKGVHQWTAGWVMQRDAGGGHGISCPVRERRWAHDDCVKAKARGLENQAALF